MGTCACVTRSKDDEEQPPFYGPEIQSQLSSRHHKQDGQQQNGKRQDLDESFDSKEDLPRNESIVSNGQSESKIEQDEIEKGAVQAIFDHSGKIQNHFQPQDTEEFDGDKKTNQFKMRNTYQPMQASLMPDRL